MEEKIFLTTQHEGLNVVDVIHKRRNDLIKDFLDDRILVDYLLTQFRITELSAVKKEFIKADLQRLLNTPVDLNWYESILHDFTTTGSTAIEEQHEKLFYKEVEAVLKKFIY